MSLDAPPIHPLVPDGPVCQEVMPMPSKPRRTWLRRAARASCVASYVRHAWLPRPRLCVAAVRQVGVSVGDGVERASPSEETAMGSNEGGSQPDPRQGTRDPRRPCLTPSPQRWVSTAPSCCFQLQAALGKQPPPPHAPTDALLAQGVAKRGSGCEGGRGEGGLRMGPTCCRRFCRRLLCFLQFHPTFEPLVSSVHHVALALQCESAARVEGN